MHISPDDFSNWNSHDERIEAYREILESNVVTCCKWQRSASRLQRNFDTTLSSCKDCCSLWRSKPGKACDSLDSVVDANFIQFRKVSRNVAILVSSDARNDAALVLVALPC